MLALKRLGYFLALVIALTLAIVYLTIERPLAVPEELVTEALPLEVSPQVKVANPSRVGINLGLWTNWGAQQYGNNVIMNPGFEGLLDSTIVRASQSDSSSFSDQRDRGFNDDLWVDADFEVRTGNGKGTRGKITRSLRNGADGLPQYFTDISMPQLESNDVVVLRKAYTDVFANFGFIPDWSRDRTKSDPAQTRPGSSGGQSLLLTPVSDADPAEYSYFIDHITERSGKLIKIEGNWRLSFWAKAERNGILEAYFVRHNGTGAYVNERIQLTPDWQEYTFDFVADDPGNPGIVQFRLKAFGSGAKIWVDDLFLGVIQETPSAFRNEVIDSLLEIRPSFIRTFAYHGDSFENRIADTYKRKAWRFRTGGGGSSDVYSFSLQELFELCERVNANPWIILPTILSDEEYFQLGQFLAQNADSSRFSEVVLEFGNENWNGIFLPQAFPNPAVHGKVAESAFSNIKLGAGEAANIRYVVNGQHVNPWLSLQYLNSTPSADTLATAPYMLFSLNSGAPDSDTLARLFGDDQNLIQTVSDVKNTGKAFAVYEVNLHTTEGNASDAERNRITASTLSGTALAKRLVELLDLGADPIMAFSLSGFEAGTPTGKTRLWGVTRDFGPPVTYRPTGLALIMLNRVVAGNFHAINAINPSAETDKLTMAAFKASDMWTAAITSENDQARSFEVRFPDDGHPIPSSYLVLQGNSPFDTNEDIKDNVKIIQKDLIVTGRSVKFNIPAYGFVVLGVTADTLLKPGAVPGAPPPPPPTEEPPPPPAEEPPPPTEEPPPPPAEDPPPPTEEPPPPAEEPTPEPEPTPTPTPTDQSISDLLQRIQELEQKQAELIEKDRQRQELIENVLNNLQQELQKLDGQ